MEKEYIVFCDESEKRGKFFSNFYGGVIVGASKLDQVVVRLNKAKEDAGIESEVKWEKTSPYDVERYQQLIHAYFNEIEQGNIRTRIMFRANSLVPNELSAQQQKDEYYLLYYQFLKHGFGFVSMPKHTDGVNLRIYLDKLPSQSKERISQFKGYIAALADNYHLRQAGLKIQHENIAEVDSKKHILLQCTDVVLGSMSFRLNDKHKAIPKGSKVRGKRTVAKEKLYKALRKEICRVTGKPNFNIGRSTTPSIFPEGFWLDPYMHWSFKPKNHVYDVSRSKHKQKSPIQPT